MPSRFIHESCRTSETLAQLSPSAERLWWRLVTVADDYGRFRAKPLIVRAVCFPVMLDKVTEQETAMWLRELVEVGAIRLYEVGGKEFGVFLAWTQYQQTRAKKSKYPEPPSASSCDHVLADVSSREQLQTAPNTDTDTDSDTSPKDPNPDPNPDPEPPTVVTPTRTRARKPEVEASDFGAFWQQYPRRDGKQQAAQVWSRLTAEERRLAAEDVPRRMLANWAGREVQHIPHASTYLHQRRWLDEIDARARLPDPRPRLSPGMERLAQAYREAQARERNRSPETADESQSPLAQIAGRSPRSG